MPKPSSYQKMDDGQHEDAGKSGADRHAPLASAPSSAPLPNATTVISTARSSGGRSLDDCDASRRPNSSSQQQLRSGLSIDHPLFRQRGLSVGSKGEDAKQGKDAPSGGDADGKHATVNAVCQSSSSLALGPVLPPFKSLTRTTSTPEATKYHPLGEDNDTDLSQAYPLTLQRSACSAFGSPSSHSFTKFRPRRAQSNSGSSDPGMSAFHPVWSCKSLSTSSAGSATGSLAGSDIGSAVSSTALGSGIGSTGRLSVRSDPLSRSLDDRKSKASSSRSPWRKKFSALKLFQRHLSGRENPARPEFDSDAGCDMVLPKELSFFGQGGVEGNVDADAAAMDAGKASDGSGDGSGSVSKSPTKSRAKKERRKRRSTSSSKGKGKEDVLISTDAKQPPEQLYADPPVALDLSDSDEDDDDIGPILGNYIPLDENAHGQRGPSGSPNVPGQPLGQDLDDQCEQHPSVEVISTSVTPTLDLMGTATVLEEMPFDSVRIFSATSIEENSSPEVERANVDGEAEAENCPYHPLGRDEQDKSTTAQGGTAPPQARLKYRSPQRSQSRSLMSGGHNPGSGSQNSPSSHDSPDSRVSSVGSPASRISSANSRATTLSGGDRTVNTQQTDGSLVADGTDSEVREANRRSVTGNRIEVNQEVAPGPDGNDTVFSSSTTSSNYHSYLQSPRPLRDGATMPVDRFFAGGNVTLSPSPSRVVYPSDQSSGTASPAISKFITLSPKKVSRIGGGSALSGGSSTGGRDATHSPHTISSNSVSNHSSSSGSEAPKKPLKFVAYEIKEERESPFDEPPMGAPIREAALIKPRISKNPHQRQLPPKVQKAPLNLPKPPQSPRQSPRKLVADRMSGARTPTRTPPPSSYKDYNSSGANTPCSPPVIVDGPNALCGDLSTRPKRPSVVRRLSAQGVAGSRGLFLIPPSSSYRPQQHPPVPAQPNTAARVNSPPSDRLTVVGEVHGANDGAQEVLYTTATSDQTAAFEKAATTVISPERQFQGTAPGPEGLGCVGLKEEKDSIAVVSPDKGF